MYEVKLETDETETTLGDYVEINGLRYQLINGTDSGAYVNLRFKLIEPQEQQDKEPALAGVAIQ